MKLIVLKRKKRAIKIIFIILIALFCFIPSRVSAKVYISEIAWMGSSNGGSGSADASDEWIEIANDGPGEVSLDGWILRIVNKKDIVISGTIAPGGFYLIERTDDESVPSVSADLISSFGTGGLKNSGEDLVLLDSEDVVKDQVFGGEDWVNIGGDNDTKETAQRSSGVWITAQGTPRSQNTSLGDLENDLVADAVDNSITPIVSSEVSTGGSDSGVYIKETVKAFLKVPKVALVGAPVKFEGKALGNDNSNLFWARFELNFGDGSVSKSQNVSHVYFKEGTYVTFLTVSANNLTDTIKQKINIVPANIFVTEVKAGQDGFITLENKTLYEFDLFGFSLKAGESIFRIPENTIILPSNHLSFSSYITRLDFSENDQVALLYPSGAILSEFKKVDEESGSLKVASLSAEKSEIPPDEVVVVKTVDDVPETKKEIIEKDGEVTEMLPQDIVPEMNSGNDLSVETDLQVANVLNTGEKGGFGAIGTIILIVLGVSVFIAVRMNKEESLGDSANKEALKAEDIKIID